MNAALSFPGSAPGTSTQALAPPRLINSLLVQVCIAIIPASIALALGYFTLFGRLFLATLLVFFVYQLVQREPLRAATLVVASIPILALCRGTFFPYSAPLVMMSVSVGVAMFNHEQLQRLRSNVLLIALTVAMAIYSWISVLITGDAAANIKVVELVASAVTVYMISWRRSLLGTALLGIGLSVIAMGLGMLPHGTRLGMTDDLEEGRFGNPILLGIPAALTLMLTLLDQGRWLLLEKKPFLRNLLALLAAGLLVLSTSRGAWAIALAGMALVFILEPSSRKNIGYAVVLGLAAIAVLLTTSRAEILTKQFDKLLDPERDWTQKTSGRSEQWVGFPDAFMAAPVLGHGPGKGRAVSLEYAHKNIPFHSLYLHIGAETGLAGLALMTLFLAKTGAQTFRHWTETNEIGPLFGLVGYMVIGLSISALDMLSGVYVGLTFVAGSRTGVWKMQTHHIKAVAR